MSARRAREEVPMTQTRRRSARPDQQSLLDGFGYNDATPPDHPADDPFATLPSAVFDRIDADAEEAGGAWEEPAEVVGSIGRTMFDTPSSEDNSLTVLLPRESMDKVPAQSLVRIN